jgi:hypothetical protein
MDEHQYKGQRFTVFFADERQCDEWLRQNKPCYQNLCDYLNIIIEEAKASVAELFDEPPQEWVRDEPGWYYRRIGSNGEIEDGDGPFENRLACCRAVQDLIDEESTISSMTLEEIKIRSKGLQ